VNVPVFNRVIRFGVFELDLRAWELRKNHLTTGLPEQSITILAMLLQLDGNRKQLWKCVSRNTCFGSPSPDGRHLAIYQSNITSNMWLLEGL